MKIDQYIDNINLRYQLGNASEHTFRGDLQQLLESIAPSIRATNTPKRQSCGAPDYILTKKDIPVGFIEVKDNGDKDLDGAKKAGNKEQFDHYKASLNNLIFYRLHQLSSLPRRQIHRQMHKELLETFDKIYILDLHGNSKKKEVCLDGSADQNVFDIMQGESINIFVKKKK
ncbi:MAG: hypothetical protein M0Q90_02670 [Bacteroidales bacterium]|nr:hypothetical protein [Bacteroidales bacterium]